MMCSGNQSAMSCTRSHSLRSATESITEWTRRVMWSLRSLMRRGVKPALMSLRSFVWSGGSSEISSSDVPSVSWAPESGTNGSGEFLNAVQSRETRCTSSKRGTTQ